MGKEIVAALAVLIIGVLRADFHGFGRQDVWLFQTCKLTTLLGGWSERDFIVSQIVGMLLHDLMDYRVDEGGEGAFYPIVVFAAVAVVSGVKSTAKVVSSPAPNVVLSGRCRWVTFGGFGRRRWRLVLYYTYTSEHKSFVGFLFRLLPGFVVVLIWVGWVSHFILWYRDLDNGSREGARSRRDEGGNLRCV